jgi:hypothetical protein
MARLVRANYRGRVPQRVARTSRAMTKVEWQYVNVNGDWHYISTTTYCSSMVTGMVSATYGP